MNNCFYCKIILEISQDEGLKDPKEGYSLEPFVFLRQERYETRV